MPFADLWFCFSWFNLEFVGYMSSRLIVLNCYTKQHTFLEKNMFFYLKLYTFPLVFYVLKDFQNFSFHIPKLNIFLRIVEKYKIKFFIR